MGLLASCKQAEEFTRSFQRTDKTVLEQELAQLHADCPGKVEIHVLGGKIAYCDCPCHASPERNDSFKIF